MNNDLSIRTSARNLDTSASFMLGLILRVNLPNRTDSRGNMLTDREQTPKLGRIHVSLKKYLIY